MMRAILLAALLSAPPAYAHDMAAWQDPERDAWYRSLKVPPAPGRTAYSCCDLTDAAHIDADRVKQVGTDWFVDLGKGFVLVPPDRVVTSPPSIDGEPYIFMMDAPTADSPNGIRCFVAPIPGY